MKKIIILIQTLFLLFQFEECIKVTDFCYKLEIHEKLSKCHGKFSLSCCDILCAKDRYSCQSLRLFAGIKNFQRTEQDYTKFNNIFQKFVSVIKNCTQPSLRQWTPNDVCSIRKDCAMTSALQHWLQFSRFTFKKNVCKCQKKHSYQCDKHQCTIDREACDYFKNKKITTNDCRN